MLLNLVTIFFKRILAYLYRSRQAGRVVRMNLANLPGGEEVEEDVDHEVKLLLLMQSMSCNCF